MGRKDRFSVSKLKDHLFANISFDVDTLSSIYHGFDCRRSDGYTFSELFFGLENILKFFEPYQSKMTFFVVGQDLLRKESVNLFANLIEKGHELSSHSFSHVQGFRLLSQTEKENEIKYVDKIFQNELGIKPLGFRAPGWNIDQSVLPILRKYGYSYDSSIFPTSFAPLLKLSHYFTTRNRNQIDRTTMGNVRNILAPRYPFITSADHIDREGRGGFVQFPIAVSPVIRLPFTATFLLYCGFEVYKQIYQNLLRRKEPIIFQFHLSDFVDYTIPELSNQIPQVKSGAYVPRALRMSYVEKEKIFKKLLDLICKDYKMLRLDHWARKLRTSMNIQKDLRN